MKAIDMLTPEELQIVRQSEHADALLQQGDAQGIRDFEELAAAGHVSAMVNLGLAYEMDAFDDSAKAEEWYRAAYSAYGDDRSKGGILFLGHYLYRYGRDEEAMRLFAEGAAKGYDICMYLLAVTLIESETPWRNKKAEVRRLLKQASERQKYPLAQRALAILLMKGKYGLGGIPLGLIKMVDTYISAVRIAVADMKDPRIIELYDYGPNWKRYWRSQRPSRAAHTAGPAAGSTR